MNYIFRGNVVFEYDPETKQMSAGEVCCDGFETNVFNFCRFIADDYILIAGFFQQAHAHSVGTIDEDELKDVNVS